MITKALSCEEENLELRTIKEVMYYLDWLKQKAATTVEYASLHKRKVFGPTMNTLISSHEEYKMVLVQKHDAQGYVTRYKAYLVAQDFTQ